MTDELVNENESQLAMDYSCQDELLEAIRSRGISSKAVDYPMFLRFTTFGPDHLGAAGIYALRMDGADVVGIGAGSGCPVHHELFVENEMIAMADHQRDATLNFPTTVQALVNWIFKQGGDVELAIPDSDEYPVDLARWVDAVGRFAIHRDKTHTQAAPRRGGDQQSAQIREDAMARELDSLCVESLDPRRVIELLQENAGMPGSCVLEATKDGVMWKADDGTQKTMDREALKKRLTRLNQKKARR